MDVEITLVNPVYQGNVGAVARVMKNFGFSKLVLVNSCALDEEARAMASHAQDVLEAAQHAPLEQVFSTSNLVIGTTGIIGPHSKLRAPYPLAALGSKLSVTEGVVSILFGPEDQGLPNAVLQQCDMLINIQTSPEYPVMNLSHAVAVILYTISSSKTVSSGKRAAATHVELSGLLQHTSEVLEAIEFPAHKRKRVLINLKRIYGRSALSSREIQMLRGVLHRIELRLKR
ncbi:MAG: RNA methyltransferase [Euryarchaeota archaeon]|nr:RNA methyltransferase [Euryarchaeota archaeon]